MKENINKLLFLDIETVGVADDLDDLGRTHPQLLKIWQSSGVDYFKRRYPDHDVGARADRGRCSTSMA